MGYLSQRIIARKEEKSLVKSSPAFAPAGQSTQLVIGASPESDLLILNVADQLYKNYHLKRIYYSGYVPVSNDKRLPLLGTPVPIIRENRLYQADWLMRYYHFSVGEIVSKDHPF